MDINIKIWNGTLSEQPSWLQIDLDNNFTVAEGSTYAFTLNSPSMCGAGTMISLNQDYSDGAMWHEGDAVVVKLMVEFMTSFLKLLLNKLNL